MLYVDEYGQKASNKPAAPYQAPPTLPEGWIHGPSNTPGLLDFLKPGIKKPTYSGPGVSDTGSRVSSPSVNQNPFGVTFSDFAPPPAAQAPSLPQFQFNLDSDPGVLSSLGLEQQGLSQLDAALKSARERAIISFGDPSLAEEAGFGLDPQAGAFARQNYLSGNATTARIDHAHQLARQAVINRLVSHGLLNSGDTGYLEGEENRNYGNQSYDAKQQMLDYLAQLFQGYNDRRTQLKQGTVSARLAAIQSYLGNPDAYAGAFG